MYKEKQMRINYKNYKVYIYTQKELSKKFTKEILEEYGKKLGFLYQNCFEFERLTKEELEDQFSLYNNFDTYEDFESLVKSFRLNLYESDIGNKIVAEEIIDILNSSRVAIAEEFIVQKTKAELYKDLVKESAERLMELRRSQDLEITLFFEKNPYTFDKELEECLDCFDEEQYLRAYMRYIDIFNKMYKYYISITHQKTDAINLTKRSLINDQLYGAAGGYDSVRRIIKASPASAVDELKFYKQGDFSTSLNKAKLRVLCGEIVGKDKDLGEYQILKDYSKAKNNDTDKVLSLVIPCLESGILNLLCLKHNINFLDDPRNSKRAAALKEEAEQILIFSEN